MPAVLLLLNTVVFWMEQSGRGEEVEGVNLLGGREKKELEYKYLHPF